MRMELATEIALCFSSPLCCQNPLQDGSWMKQDEEAPLERGASK